MNNMINIFTTFSVVALGSAVGGMFRNTLSKILLKSPFKKLPVNLAGAFLCGGLWEATQTMSIVANFKNPISMGILGAFAAFTVSFLNTDKLLKKKQAAEAIISIALSCGLGLIALGFGVTAVRYLITFIR